ncbi:hypothetical protein EYD10_14065 [Varanus komodoensis]|nr:hypothetical protein EYD10_14065 [Varanus komodoensis]
MPAEAPKGGLAMDKGCLRDARCGEAFWALMRKRPLCQDGVRPKACAFGKSALKICLGVCCPELEAIFEMERLQGNVELSPPMIKKLLPKCQLAPRTRIAGGPVASCISLPSDPALRGASQTVRGPESREPPGPSALLHSTGYRLPPPRKHSRGRNPRSPAGLAPGAGGGARATTQSAPPGKEKRKEELRREAPAGAAGRSAASRRARPLPGPRPRLCRNALTSARRPCCSAEETPQRAANARRRSPAKRLILDVIQ